MTGELAERTAGLGTLALLEQAGQITETALTLPEETTLEQWEAIGRYLGEIHSRARFYIGDWLNFGEGLYEDRYAQAMEATGLGYDTVRNYASICHRVARSRRRKELRFGHHEAVAKLSPAQQRRWLAAAVGGGWTRDRLREEIRASLPAAPAAPEPVPTARQAVDAGRGLSEVRETLRRAERGEDVTEALPAALRAVEEVGGTLRAALDAAPSTREVARRLLEEAVPDGDAHYRVPRETLDELRGLVADEGGTE